MSRTTWILGIIILIAVLAGAYALLQPTMTQAPGEPQATDGTQSTGTSGTGNAAVGANGVSSIITYTDAGFSPATLTVAVGTTVTWSNKSSGKLWVAAPGTSCPVPDAATTLNECQAVSAGGTYSFTFALPGAVTYANQEHPSHTGAITVTADSKTQGTIRPEAIPD